MLLRLFILWANVAVAAEVDVFRCASEIHQIMDSNSQMDSQSGMIFTHGNILRKAGPATPVLMIVNERGTYLIPIQSGRLNRIVVNMPDPDPRKKNRNLYMSFSQSEVFGSKIIAMSFDVPPIESRGFAHLPVSILAASDKFSRWLILRTIESELQRMQDLYLSGQLNERHLLSGNLSLCRGLSSASLQQTLSLNRQIAELEAPMKISRSPAGFH